MIPSDIPAETACDWRGGELLVKLAIAASDGNPPPPDAPATNSCDAVSARMLHRFGPLRCQFAARIPRASAHQAREVVEARNPREHRTPRTPAREPAVRGTANTSFQRRTLGRPTPCRGRSRPAPRHASGHRPAAAVPGRVCASCANSAMASTRRYNGFDEPDVDRRQIRRRLHRCDGGGGRAAD